MVKEPKNLSESTERQGRIGYGNLSGGRWSRAGGKTTSAPADSAENGKKVTE